MSDRRTDAEHEAMMCNLSVKYVDHATRAIGAGVVSGASLTAHWVARQRGANFFARASAVLGAGAWCSAAISWYCASSVWDEMCLKHRS